MNLALSNNPAPVLWPINSHNYRWIEIVCTFTSIQATDEQSQQTNAVTYIQNLLELKDRFDSFLQQSFGNDKFFKQVIFLVSIFIINRFINLGPYLVSM